VWCTWPRRVRTGSTPSACRQRAGSVPAACRQRGKDIKMLDGCWHTFPKSPGLMNEKEIDDLIEACRAQDFLPDIIVIDTLTRSAGGADINSPTTGAGLLIGMERLAQAFDATVLAITHPGKDTDRGAIGSSLIESLAFGIWRVALDGKTVWAEVEKMKEGPFGFSVPFKVEWLDDQGNTRKWKDGTPVVVDPEHGEELESEKDNKADAAVSELLVRQMLARRNAYGIKSALREAILAGDLAGPKPDEADDETRLEWENGRVKIAQGLRNARSKREWAKKLVEKRVVVVGAEAVWIWFLPEGEQPVPQTSEPY
jgi:hypothetical protein